MKNIFILLSVIYLTFHISIQSFAQQNTELKIDPLMFVSLKECRNIYQKIGNQLFFGWQFAKTPVLFYRPKVQEVLINYPHMPKGFSEYKGFNPLGNEKIYYRNETTFFDIDGQNTSFDIDSIKVLTVADRSSNLRNQLVDVTLNRPKEVTRKFLDEWSFIPSAYDDIFTILHESFHVYQHSKAPNKFANEVVVIKYPVLDPVNNALYVLEGNALRDALLAKDAGTRMNKAKEFVAVRTYRQSLLDSACVEYENLNEYAEGLAKYIEFAFAKKGTALVPGKEMNYYAEFNGYGDALTKLLEGNIKKMVGFVSVNNDSFENKFGAGPLRFKLYYLGACEGLLLDDLMPSWKSKIFNENVYFADLLKESVKLSATQVQEYLQSAKKDYNYEKALADKQQFQKEGEIYAQNKANQILKTDKTLIRITYGGFTERAGLSRFTPFGITKISQTMSIYDMVPVIISFRDGVKLDMRKAHPVIIDKENKQVLFAIDTAPSEIKLLDGNKFENSDFLLSGADMLVSIEGNIVDIIFKKQ